MINNDNNTNIIFFNVTLTASLITSITRLIFFKYFNKTITKTTARIIQRTETIVNKTLFIFKKLKYFTLAAFTPSFKLPGKYSLINITTPNAINTATKAKNIIHITKLGKHTNNTISTKLLAKAINAEYKNNGNASSRSKTNP